MISYNYVHIVKLQACPHNFNYLLMIIYKHVHITAIIIIIIIIIYIYHALINALSAHMIHVNLNMIFYTHVEHSPTKTIYMWIRL